MTLVNPVLKEVFTQFQTEGTFTSAQPFGTGHINDTFLVCTAEKNCANYILQRINQHIFKDVPALMHNILLVTQHVQNKLRKRAEPDLQRKCLTLILNHDQKPFVLDSQNSYWACYLFIENSLSHDNIQNSRQAFEGGKTFGNFLNLLSDFPANLLHETLPNFHNVEFRLNQFDTALSLDCYKRAAISKDEINFVITHADEMKYILQLGRSGKIPVRLTHNDTKFNNVLLDTNDNGLCVIDLDTVMPGFVHYDFGDAVRTLANTAAEDEKDLNKIDFNMALFESFCRGFLGQIKSFLTPMEISSLAPSTPLLPFLMGLRFLTDYLSGDHYYKINFPEHNLQRARAQFQFIRRIKDKMPEIERIVVTNL